MDVVILIHEDSESSPVICIIPVARKTVIDNVVRKPVHLITAIGSPPYQWVRHLVKSRDTLHRESP